MTSIPGAPLTQTVVMMRIAPAERKSRYPRGDEEQSGQQDRIFTRWGYQW
jgi:hypothetical protein